MPDIHETPNFPPHAQEAVWRIFAGTPSLAHLAIVHYQIAQPQIAAGVDQHSEKLRNNPWQRRHSTIKYARQIVYGSQGEAAEAARAIGRAHAPVRGTVQQDVAPHYTPETPYSAFDPQLQRVVIETNIFGVIKGHEAFVGPLSPDQKDAYTKEYAEHFGAHFRNTYTPDNPAPTTYTQLEDSINAMLDDGRLKATDVSRRLSSLIINPLPARLSTLTQQLQPALESHPQLAAGLVHLNHEIFQRPYSAVRPLAHGLARVATGGLLPEPLRDQFFPDWSEADHRAFSALSTGLTFLAAGGEILNQRLGSRIKSIAEKTQPKIFRQAVARWQTAALA